MNSFNPQQDHYERIHDDYADHYYDSSSMEYRRQFIFRRLLEGTDLAGLSVADIACGDGHNSLIIREFFPTVQLHGFDISPTACETYRKMVGAPASNCDFLTGAAPKESFDAALVIGGLHHMVADLDRAMTAIHQMLKPGSVLLIVEPNKDYFLNAVRSFWYKQDRYFDNETEAPLDLGSLAQQYSGLFRVEWSKYFGGPAYFTILNSLVLRIPISAKPWIAPTLMAFDKVFDALPGKKAFPAFMARLRRV